MTPCDSDVTRRRRDGFGRVLGASTSLLAATTLCAAAQGTPSDRLDEGRALAERLCAECHAIEALGASPFPAAPPFREIAKRYSVWHLQEALAEGIVVGHDAMPRFELPPDEIDALLHYMDTVGGTASGG